MKYLMILFLVAGLGICGKAHAQNAATTDSSTGSIQNVNGDNTYVGLWSGSIGMHDWNGSAVSRIGPGWVWTCNNCTGPQAGTVTGASLNSIGNPADWAVINLNVPGESGATYVFYPPPTTPVSAITADQQAAIDSARARVNYITRNSIYIDQVGSSNTIIVQQNGTQNSVAGLGQQSMPIQGSGNTVKIRQGDPSNPYGQNLIEAEVYGSYNTLGLNQGTTLGNQTNGQDNGQHYQAISVTGTGNQVNSEQTNTGGGGHYLSTTVNGDYNTVNTSQTDNTAKASFVNVQGDLNTVATSQSGLGQHYLSVNLLGTGNSATVNQSGSTANNASISITNAGGPGSVNLTQTGGQNYYINTMCVTAGGCQPVTVRQGN